MDRRARSKRWPRAIRARNSTRRTTLWCAGWAYLLHRSRLRQRSRSPRTRFQRRLPCDTRRAKSNAVAKWQTRPNGIALSADGKMLFVTRFRPACGGGFRSGSQRRGDESARCDHERSGRSRRDPHGCRRALVCRGAKASRFTRPTASWSARCSKARLHQLRVRRNDFESLFISARGEHFSLKLGVKGALQY